MLGFAEKGRATVGVIVWPTRKRTFVGFEGAAAYERSFDGSQKPIAVTKVLDVAQATMLVSRSRLSPPMVARLARIGVKTMVPCGSSGLKAALVAAGEADLYAHPATLGKRWDTCAGEALVRAAGGEATDLAGNALDYAAVDLANRGGFVASNGHLHNLTIERLGGDTGQRDALDKEDL
jgi:3'(2'), 5'-bisphosphate nucleotidase